MAKVRVNAQKCDFDDRNQSQWHMLKENGDENEKK
jgi:hypothetical protein